MRSESWNTAAAIVAMCGISEYCVRRMRMFLSACRKDGIVRPLEEISMAAISRDVGLGRSLSSVERVIRFKRWDVKCN